MKQMYLKRLTRNHHEIKNWVQERNGRPAVFKDNETDKAEDLLYFDFLSNGENVELQKISWTDFFRRFDSERLAMIYENKIFKGEESKSFKFIKLDHHN